MFGWVGVMSTALFIMPNPTDASLATTVVLCPIVSVPGDPPDVRLAKVQSPLSVVVSWMESPEAGSAGTVSCFQRMLS
jgi:hypothetical protein